MKRLLKLFEIYNLEEEGREWVSRNIGIQYVEEFSEMYENINRGIPIGGIMETAAFIDMVEQIKKDLEKEKIIWKIKNILKQP